MESDKYKLSGKNNGSLIDRLHPEGDPSWVDEEKEFVLIDDDRSIRFYPMGRDGGSLNCWGGYCVRVISV